MSEDLSSSFEAICLEVCEERGLPLVEVLGRRRKLPLVYARQECYLRVRERSGCSYPVIGRYFGRDHTTILYGCEAAKERRKEDGKLERGVVVHSGDSLDDGLLCEGESSAD